MAATLVFTAGHRKPSGHSSHWAFAAAADGMYVPLGQTQASALVLCFSRVVRGAPCLNDGHCVHGSSPCLSLYNPAGHGSHASFLEKVPGGQMHRSAAAAPVPFVTLPPVHSMQVVLDMAPFIAENVFARHSLHMPLSK